MQGIIEKSEKTIEERAEKMKSLKKTIDGRDATIARLKEELSEAHKEIERLKEIINKLKEGKASQTNFNGRYRQAIGGIPNYRKGLRVGKTNWAKLESAELSKDIDGLIKVADRFTNDNSNHRGELLYLVAWASRGIVATSATDKTVRLWRIKPDASGKGGNKKCIVNLTRVRRWMDGSIVSTPFYRKGKKKRKAVSGKCLEGSINSR